MATGTRVGRLEVEGRREAEASEGEGKTAPLREGRGRGSKGVKGEGVRPEAPTASAEQ